jgi:hypothetical protein
MPTFLPVLKNKMFSIRPLVETIQGIGDQLISEISFPASLQGKKQQAKPGAG